ncbi:MAG: class I tRNA ligase family protein [Patescibacteria group bacterium]
MRSEDEVLGFWARKKIFERSVKQGGARARRFVFFEGPPYANGMPGIHHVEARAFKDVVARYKTMRGFRVERRAGWDTHGLPTEMAVEKKLGIKSKREIEERVGLRAFVEAARADVFIYKSQFEHMTERMGYWLDFENAYVTMHNSYIESLWWIIQQFHKKGLLYEDNKISPWCVRCGTTLSSHELAQGYKKVTDESVYVRFHLKERRAALLVWTTTPWTLPANVAAAVAPDLEYVTVDDRGEKFILLGTLASKLFPELKPLWREKGASLLGLKYEPLYPHEGNAYSVVAGDFITDADGTGVVHIAPAFGEDDMQVGKREGLAIFNTIDDDGKFTDAVPQWRGIFVKDADPLIIKDLDQKGYLWRRVPYEHEYPHCWRCDTPLLYRARRSWWVRVSSIRKELVKENSKIEWHPGHLRDGRFGEWIREAKDWAFSRERYWGAPLPIWKCPTCVMNTVIGSAEEISRLSKKSDNTYYLMRHGFSKSNLLGVGSSLPKDDTYGLTPRGKAEVKKIAASLKKVNIDLIIASNLLRTKESAAILARELRVPILYDDELQDIHLGDLERTTESISYRDGLSNEEKFVKKFPGHGGESWGDVRDRMYRFYKKTESLHQRKNLLVVGHADPLWFLESIIGANLEPDQIPSARYMKNGELHKVKSRALPRNDKGETDFHKPYIDEIELSCEVCATPMTRVHEVADVWFDSGSMPYAAWHYPFENKERIDKKISYPADFIAEGIDQTRGWFYLLLTVSTLLGKGAPYKNVMSLGHVLDKAGKKMSKSKGNGVDPLKLFEKYGADAVRWYFFTINQPEDSKLFNEEDVVKAKRNFLDLLLNTLRFYELYGSSVKKTRLTRGKSKQEKVTHVLDRWILSRLAALVDDATRRMDAYDIVGAARAIEDFVANDVSRWYVRRSRDRMKDGAGLQVLRSVLLDLARLSAPFTPFAAEIVYRALDGDAESVHLDVWPARRAYTKKLNSDMLEARRIAAQGLELRARASIKVRQPLASLTLKRTSLKDKALFEILKEELNVKKIFVDKSIDEEVVLDVTITSELKTEGEIRELIRSLQDERKKQDLQPKDFINVEYFVTDNAVFPRDMLDQIKKGARIKTFTTARTREAIIQIGVIAITKVTKSL